MIVKALLEGRGSRSFAEALGRAEILQEGLEPTRALDELGSKGRASLIDALEQSLLEMV